MSTLPLDFDDANPSKQEMEDNAALDSHIAMLETHRATKEPRFKRYANSAHAHAEAQAHKAAALDHSVLMRYHQERGDRTAQLAHETAYDSHSRLQHLSVEKHDSPTYTGKDKVVIKKKNDFDLDFGTDFSLMSSLDLSRKAHTGWMDYLTYDDSDDLSHQHSLADTGLQYAEKGNHRGAAKTYEKILRDYLEPERDQYLKMLTQAQKSKSLNEVNAYRERLGQLQEHISNYSRAKESHEEIAGPRDHGFDLDLDFDDNTQPYSIVNPNLPNAQYTGRVDDPDQQIHHTYVNGRKVSPEEYEKHLIEGGTPSDPEGWILDSESSYCPTEANHMGWLRPGASVNKGEGNDQDDDEASAQDQQGQTDSDAYHLGSFDPDDAHDLLYGSEQESGPKLSSGKPSAEHTLESEGVSNKPIEDVEAKAKELKSKESLKVMKGATKELFRNLSPAGKVRLHKNVSNIAYFDSPDELMKALKAQVPEINSEPDASKIKLYNSFLKDSKKIFVDGGNDPSLTKEVQAAAIGRAIADGADETPEWHGIYEREIKGGKLTWHADSNEKAAWSEFVGRLIHSHGVSAEQLSQRFPSATAYVQGLGLLPDTNKNDMVQLTESLHSSIDGDAVEGDSAFSPKKAALMTFARIGMTYFKGGMSKLSDLEKAAFEKSKSILSGIPAPIRLTAAGFLHYAFYPYIAATKKVKEFEMRRGDLAPEERERLANILGHADAMVGGKLLPLIVGVMTGSELLGIATSFMPIGSIAYLTLAKTGLIKWNTALVNVRRVIKSKSKEEGESKEFSDFIKEHWDTPAFKNWFGGSQIVNKQGNPQVVYHKTNKQFRKFKIPSSAIGIHVGTAEQARRLGLGGENEDGTEDKTGQRTFPLYASIKNPLVVTDDDVQNPHAMGAVLDRLGYKAEAKKLDDIYEAKRGILRLGPNNSSTSGNNYKDIWPEKYHTVRNGQKINSFESRYKAGQETEGKAGDYVRKILIDLGYDGLKYQNKIEGPGYSYVALDPNQLKSALVNRGTYSKKRNEVDFAGKGPDLDHFLELIHHHLSQFQGDPNNWIACFFAAMDETYGNVEEACRIADMAAAHMGGHSHQLNYNLHREFEKDGSTRYSFDDKEDEHEEIDPHVVSEHAHKLLKKNINKLGNTSVQQFKKNGILFLPNWRKEEILEANDAALRHSSNKNHPNAAYNHSVIMDNLKGEIDNLLKRREDLKKDITFKHLDEENKKYKLDYIDAIHESLARIEPIFESHKKAFDLHTAQYDPKTGQAFALDFDLEPSDVPAVFSLDFGS